MTFSFGSTVTSTGAAFGAGAAAFGAGVAAFGAGFAAFGAGFAAFGAGVAAFGAGVAAFGAGFAAFGAGFGVDLAFGGAVAALDGDLFTGLFLGETAALGIGFTGPLLAGFVLVAGAFAFADGRVRLAVAAGRPVAGAGFLVECFADMSRMVEDG